MANPFVHVELNTPDPDKTKAFYSKLFQWQLEDIPNPAVPTGPYTIIKVGEGTGGGIMKLDGKAGRPWDDNPKADVNLDKTETALFADEWDFVIEN